jgi:hypothetical protein
MFVDRVGIEPTTLSLQKRIAKPWYMPAHIGTRVSRSYCPKFFLSFEFCVNGLKTPSVRKKDRSFLDNLQKPLNFISFIYFTSQNLPLQCECEKRRLVVRTGLEPAISPAFCQRALPISHLTMFTYPEITDK